jgi:predicted transcriptional regulator
MPESEEAQKELVELKHDVRDIKHTLDAQFYEDRAKWEGRVLNAVDDDATMIQVLMAIDCEKSAREIQNEIGLGQVKCWRILNRLERRGIIFKLEETKEGSVVYCKSRWYKILRLDEVVQKKLSSHLPPLGSIQDQNDAQRQQSA